MSRSSALRRWLPLGAIAPLAVTLALSATTAVASPPAITLTSSASTVAAGDVIDLTATVPVTDETGTITNEIVQHIDPTKTHLVSVEDVIAPAGWTVSYSYDNGASWTTTEPDAETGTTTSWDKVSAVKASGSFVSGGSSAGKQIMSDTA